MLQARVADSSAAGRQRERRGDLLEPFRLLGARRSALLRQSALELLERKAGLVGEAPDDRDRGRIRPIYHRLPRHDEHELRPPPDDDRRPQRRSYAEFTHTLESLIACLARDVGHERDAEPRNRIRQAREVCERNTKTQRPLRAARSAVHELQILPADAPEHAVVGAERHARLTTDDRSHLLRGLGVEAWGDLENALERAVGLALALVEPSALECLLGEPGRRRRDRDELVVERVRAIEEELDGADGLARSMQRNRRSPTARTAGGGPALSGNSASSVARSSARTTLPSRTAVENSVLCSSASAAAGHLDAGWRCRWLRPRGRRRSRGGRAAHPVLRETTLLARRAPTRSRPVTPRRRALR